MRYGFGVDVGGTSIKLGLFDETGKLLEEYGIPTNTDNGGRAILPDIAVKIKEAISTRGISGEDIIGIGIGVPGPVKEERVVNKCVNLGWGVMDVAGELEDLTGYKVKAGNDANVAALGEYWKGSGIGYSSACMVTLGTGVGGGIVIDDKIVNGAHGAAGEIGHIGVPSTERRECTCGKINCLERFASAGAVERVTGKSCAQVFEEAKAGDAKSLATVDDVVEKLAFAMGNISCVSDVECFIIGGGMSKAGDFLIDKIKEAYPANAFHASRDTAILPASLGNQAGMYGAFKLML